VNDNVVYHAQHLRCCFIGRCEQRETEVTLLARLVELARGVDADPASIGLLSTGEACAVALLLVRSIYSTAAITRSTFLIGLAPNGKNAVRDLHSSGWRQ
jgi:hypothetical protein